MQAQSRQSLSFRLSLVSNDLRPEGQDHTNFIGAAATDSSQVRKRKIFGLKKDLLAMKRHWTLPGLLTALVLATLPVAAESTASDPTAENDESGIRATLQAYIDGTTFNDTELIKSAFYDDARLFLSHPEREIWIVSIDEYLGFFANKEKGKPNGREGKVLRVDRTGDIATAEAEIRSTSNEARYIDLFLLKRIQGQWKIISKSATRTH